MKSILITGSSGHLGSKLSSEFHKKNNRVFGIDINVGQSLYYEKFFLGDVLDEKFMKETANFFLKNNLKIDSIVNCFYHPENQYLATRSRINSAEREKLLWEAFSNYSSEEFTRELGLNVAGLHNVNRFLIPCAQGGKLKVVNIGSVLGERQPNPADLDFADRFRYKPPGYSVSKRALAAYTEYCANIFAGTEFRFNTVVPGFIQTSSTSQSLEFEKRMTRRMSVKRFASSNDIFNAVEFLTSDRSDYINGQHIVVDGGYLVS